MKKRKVKFLNKKDRNKINKILKQERNVRIYKRALTLKSIDLGNTQASIGELGLGKERTVRNLECLSQKYL